MDTLLIAGSTERLPNVAVGYPFVVSLVDEPETAAPVKSPPKSRCRRDSCVAVLAGRLLERLRVVLRVGIGLVRPGRRAGRWQCDQYRGLVE